MREEKISELRQEPCTKRWVIISPQRARRPKELEEKEEKVELPEWDRECPFCPGNEDKTPPEVFLISGQRGWTVRVVPNKFPALSSHITHIEVIGIDPFVSVPGGGKHEVVIESPLHNVTWGNIELGQMEMVVSCFLQRYRALREDERLKYICIFRNHGERAGTSLIHPHSQIIATPIVPEQIRTEVEEARRYYDDRLRCVYCDVVKSELRAKERTVLESKHFIAFTPFASRVPFEIWIVPKIHRPSFDLIGEGEAKDLAQLINELFGALYRGLNDPHYNVLFHSAPLRDSCEDYYHWHIEVLPRTTIPAGFELGTGIYINTTLPEDAARFLRQYLKD